MTDNKKNVTNMGKERMEMLEKHMDDNGRNTSKSQIDHHKNGFKMFVNNEIVGFDPKKMEEYMKEYCENDVNFEVEIKDKADDKPKRKLSPEHLAKMQEGRRKKAEEKKAAAGAGASDKEEEEKPKARKPKAAAH